MKYKLDDIKKNTGMQVPDNYFEELPLKIQGKIDSSRSTKSIHLFNYWKMAAATAAAVALLLVFIPNRQPDAEQLLAEVPETALIAYLDELEMDEYDIAKVFNEDVESMEFTEDEILDAVELEGTAIDDLLIEYDLDDELL